VPRHSTNLAIRAAIWGLVFAVTVFAQTEAEEPVYELGPGVTPPRVTHQVNPEYSGTRGVRVTGAVLIGLTVTSRGLPKDVHVVKSLEKDVDQSALDAVKQWRFDPARKDAKPVAVHVTLELEFHSM
jgi:periplasmic protein TonB